MIITVPCTAWLHNPADLAAIIHNPQSIIGYASLFMEGLNMEHCSYTKLGTATVTYTVDLSGEEATAAAAKAITEKMARLEEEHEGRMRTLRESLRKLQAITWEG